ncbi:MAG: amino acid adenylation domain-containing protein [Paramuribaculum sp.]|nr:amino acid adenylation domain-containing protein [Paramuribaculum sp.]
MQKLSKSQVPLYADVQSGTPMSAYNRPYLYTLDSSIDGAKLLEAIKTALNAHPGLSVEVKGDENGEGCQEQKEDAYSLAVETQNDRLTEAISDNSGKTVIRLLTGGESPKLFISLNHLTADGKSRKILLDDIEKAYMGEPIEQETFSWSDYVRKEAKTLDSELLSEAKEYYRRRFEGEEIHTPILNDQERTDHIRKTLSYEPSVSIDDIERFCKETGIYRNTLMTAAYGYMLAKFNMDNRSLFTSIIDGRDEKSKRSTGMMVTTIPVTTSFDKAMTTAEYLHETEKQLTESRKYPFYGYYDIRESQDLRSDSLFVWHGELFDRPTFAGKPLQTESLAADHVREPLYIKAYVEGGKLKTDAIYDSGLYSEKLIESVLESYEAALQGMLMEKEINSVNITSAKALAELDRFNETSREYDESATIIDLFRKQASVRPEATAVVYEDRKYSYAEVDRLSDKIACHMLKKGIKKGEAVSILIARSEWMVIASLGVIKAGATYQPLDPTYPKERINFMMEDATSKFLITDVETADLASEYAGERLYTSQIKELPDADIELPELNPDMRFILLYTSGSTGVPKGCELLHRNIAAFCAWYTRRFDLNENSKIAAYASYGFDADMMDLYPALTTGGTVHIIAEEIRLDLPALNNYFDREGITHSFMTTQVGYQFATSMENHSLLHLLTGGEKLASLTPPKGYKLHNIYGPTETTVCVTTYEVNRKEENIPIGKAIDNIKLYIADSEGRRVPVGAAGELWIAGRQVSSGYLNQPEKTASTYIENPFTDEPDYRRIYRTGDIVRYLPTGDISFVGRRDGQVKIRGFRIELKEVESIIRDYPGIKDVTVQAYDDAGGGKFIAAYIVSDEKIDINKLNAFILSEKPPYMVPGVTMQIEKIPLNQNQKVNRKDLPEPKIQVTTETETTDEEPMNILETQLHETISEITGNKDFKVTTPLLYAGLTSIMAIKLAVKINKLYGVSIDPKKLIKNGTLQTIENELLAHLLNEDREERVTKDETTTATGKSRTEAPLSYAQTGVYFECLKNPASTVYNISMLLTFPEGTEAEKLAKTVEEAVKAHAGLNVRFDTRDGAIVQTTEGAPDPKVEIKEIKSADLEQYKREFIKPFNLQRAPLYRFEVIKTDGDQGRVYLLMDVHHLVFDGTSADLLIREICEGLESGITSKESFTLLDFVGEQSSKEGDENYNAAKAYFDKMLSTAEGASEIPGDLKPGGTPGHTGEASTPINMEEISEKCKKLNITPAHLYFAATAYVVSRYTNNRDVYLSTVSSGRSDIRIAETVGMFVNTLPLGISIDDITTGEFLERASQIMEETLEHENYPFAKIAADFNYHPEVNYAYQAGMLTAYETGGKEVKHELVTLDEPRFKINVRIENDEIVIEYDDSVYTEGLAEGLAESIAATAERMADNTDKRVREMSIVSERQSAELDKIRDGGKGEIKFRLLQDGLIHFTEVHPDKEALIATDGTFTYAELDKITNRIAHALRERGVKPRDRVALLLPRNSRLVMALYGVLKSGAAYIPCDPDYPSDRVKLIIEDSEAKYIITTEKLMDTVPADKAINVEDLICHTDASPIDPEITPDDLAYIIYTSGSTGRPKGVMLRHEGICNYMTPDPANVYAYALAQYVERALCVATISFDVALQDIAAPYAGKTIVMATEEQANNPIELAKIIREGRIDMVSATPSRWATWLTSEDLCDSLKTVRVIRAEGEKFPEPLLRKMQSLTDARILNVYGPTEITISSNIMDLTHSTTVTVGKPLFNVKEYVVDSDGNELPVGVVGELYIGGKGVGRGYNNLEEMTKTRFIDYKGTRVYRSGDYARWLPDGDVVILGRTDNQIKLRGLRIELGEIESVMQKVAGIDKVVVMIRKIHDKEHLCAYYTADRPIPADELKAEISKSLTKYMVPTAYMQLEKMPMTPNGKTDQKALPEPVLAAETSYVEPANDKERTFAGIFAGILDLDKVGATDNFFDLGGTSLVVTRVIIEADKAGLHIAYGDVFANPTPRKLARLISGEGSEEASSSDEGLGALSQDYDYSSINRVLAKNTLATFKSEPCEEPSKKVLLTGATGFLGIHILKDLLDGEAEITCLVRGKTQQEAEMRLKTLLFFYFDKSYEELWGKRIKVVCGDVTAAIDLSIEADTVYNCAAIVKHFSHGTEIEDINIGGAKRCMEYCLKTGAKLIHISTASTAGLWVGEERDRIFTEQDLYIGQYLDNQYIGSKFLAERMILEAVATKGLKAKIMRLGNLAARSSDGEFQANFSTNSFMGRIKVFNMLGCCPYSMCTDEVEFSPINEVAHAITLLAGTPDGCTVFHPYNNHSQLLGDVLRELRTVGDGIRFVEDEDFDRAMDEAKSDPQKSKLLASLLAYQDMAHGQRTVEVKAGNDYTTQLLYRYGFSWSPTSWDYIERMLTAIGGLGFFDNQLSL